ncbi:MAG: PorT family protein [Saprospiraceae bacterium]|nr:PorT family protein [Saprospiraceae bacterium]
MNLFHRICIIVLTFIINFSGLGTNEILGQGFKGTAIIGMNASQVDGDDWAGYDKFGLQVGGRLSYRMEGSMDVSLEMLYSQRGAAEKRFAKGDEKNIRLNYFEIPVIFSLKDWYIEKGDYYKARAEAGLSYGYLFEVQTPLFDEQNFKKNDLSWLLGVGYQFGRRIGMSLRYTSSFGKIYRNEIENTNTLLSYFLSARLEFHF